LQEVPEEVRAAMDIQLVETLDEVLSMALLDACPTDAGPTDAEAADRPPVWTTDQPPSQPSIAE
jgi:hypothetical protein